MKKVDLAFSTVKLEITPIQNYQNHYSFLFVLNLSALKMYVGIRMTELAIAKIINTVKRNVLLFSDQRGGLASLVLCFYGI